MKSIKKILLSLILMPLLSGCMASLYEDDFYQTPHTPTPSEPSEPSEPDTPVDIEGYSATVLVYMCGSNLESDYANNSNSETHGIGLATSDIKEMLSVPNKPSDVNVVIQTGGAKKWTNKSYGKYGSESISADYLQRWHIENQKLVKDGNNITYASMGLESTLQSFLEYGLSTYPADKTSLILWNHGGAMQGVCFDEKKNDDGLDGYEVYGAVKNACKKLGITKKLDWIGYDACLMGMQDLAVINSEYFNYMVGSQELEVGYGWDYDNWLDDLYKKKPTTTILEEICDKFVADNDLTEEEKQDYYNYYHEEYVNDQTLAYYDLSYAEEYKTAWENMSSVLKNKISNKSSFRTFVKTAKLFADYYDEDNGIYLYNVYGTVDVKDFITKLSNSSTYNPGSTYIDAILSAFSKLVPHCAKGDGAGNAYGLSMFYAISSYCYKSECYTTNDTPMKNWQSLVAAYGY